MNDTQWVYIGKKNRTLGWNQHKKEQEWIRGYECECWYENENGKIVKCKNNYQDAHHCFIKREKNKKRLLDVPENMQLVCKHCHENRVNTGINKEKHMEMQRKRYDMEVWWNKLDDIMRLNNVYIGKLIKAKQC